MKEERSRRNDYPHFHAITTRWMDNDAYGHVNNVVYYSWFDTVVNQFLVSGGVLDIGNSPAVGLVVETQCNYFAPVAFPERISAGLRVAKVGNSSVRYELAIFREDDVQAAAQGHFIHVYVDRASRNPCPVPGNVRTLLRSIQQERH